MERFASLSTSQVLYDPEEDTYSIDENEDGSSDYQFSNPDFNFAQFRSNMVIRWEYIPGSTLFLVWTQNMNGEFLRDSSQYKFDFSEQARNIFLVKYTYRFIR